VIEKMIIAGTYLGMTSFVFHLILVLWIYMGIVITGTMIGCGDPSKSIFLKLKKFKFFTINANQTVTDTKILNK
jgi:hypothetical protein